MPPAIRVLHVSAAGVYGGNEEHLRTLFTHTDPARVETHLAAPPRSALFRKALDLGIQAHPLVIRGGADLPAAFRLMRILQRVQPDLLHTHNRWEDALAFLLKAFLGNLCWVTTLHDHLNMDQQGVRVRTLKGRLYCRMLRRADLVMANARATAADAREEARLDPAKVLAITNGQDLSRLEGVAAAPALLARGLVTPDRGDRIACRVGLFARLRGRAVQKKGIPEFLEAAAQVLRGGLDASFTVVGADAAAEAEMDRLAGRGVFLVDTWKVIPFTEDARPLMKGCDIVVCPSRFEGLPRALMEAMGLGCAVIGTRVDGIGEIIEHEVSGLLVPPRDPQALADAIRRLAGDPALRERLGAAAARRVREHYGAARMAREHEEAYQRLYSTRP